MGFFPYATVVVGCKAISFQGTSGIMIRETANTFGLITQDNKFRGTLPTSLTLITLTLLPCFPMRFSLIVFWKHLPLPKSADSELIPLLIAALFELQLYPSMGQFLCSELVAGKLHCMGTAYL